MYVLAADSGYSVSCGVLPLGISVLCATSLPPLKLAAICSRDWQHGLRICLMIVLYWPNHSTSIKHLHELTPRDRRSSYVLSLKETSSFPHVPLESNEVGTNLYAHA